MTSHRSLTENEQVWLDELFEQVVARLEDGLSVDSAALCAGHEHLQAQVDELVALAGQIAIGRGAARPQVEGFEVLREIGRGGMGTVYLARQQRVGGRLVALKVLPAGVVRAPQARTRLAAEARTIARLAHPNVVVVHDLVIDDAGCAYAMEWVDGCTLADLLARCGRHGRTIGSTSRDAELRAAAELLDQGDLLARHRTYVTFICRIGIALARALAAVHGAGLVHRDVKPSNVLLRRDGTPLLSDFGLVRDAGATLTQAGHFAGTLAYAPPEQLRGDSSAIDARSDVYALGATLYHALALRVPFAGANPLELATQIERGLARPLRGVNPRVPFDLQTIVAKAMDADPRRRYQTADELAEDLERLLSLQPIRARPAGLLTRSIKLVRRNRGTFSGIIAGGLSALAVATLLVVYFVLMPRWAAEHTRDARLALLDPGQANDIVSVLYWGRINTRGGEALWARASVLDAALVRYSAALRLAPLDDQLRHERHAVTAARDALLSTTAADLPSTSSSLRAAEPLSRARSTGLYAFLTDDYPTAIREWTAYESARDPLAEPDPLVSAALGVLYLFDDQPGRAYPRLRDAVRAFPKVSFLTTYLADAALKAGDVDHAEWLLRDAALQPHRDTFGGPERVAAGILAARRRLDEAERAYRALPRLGPSLLEFGRFLAHQGRTDDALETLMNAAGLGGPVPQRVYRAALDQWWAGLTPRERRTKVLASLELSVHDPRSLAARLRAYVDHVPPWRPDPRLGVLASSLRHLVAPSLSSHFFAALFTALSSPSLQSLSLSELAQRMEVQDMSLWNRIISRRYARIVKDLRIAGWRWPILKPAGRLAEATGDALRGLNIALAEARRFAVGASLGFAATAYAGNLVQNPSFEAGDLSSWQVTGNVVARQGGATSGTWAAHFSYLDTPNDGVLWQEISTVPGQHYRLSFDYSVYDCAGNAQSIRVALLDGGKTLAQETYGPFSYGPMYGTTRHSIDFTAGLSPTVLRFQDVSAQTSCADGTVDNVSVEAVGCSTAECLGLCQEVIAGGIVGGFSVAVAPPEFGSYGGQVFWSDYNGNRIWRNDPVTGPEVFASNVSIFSGGIRFGPGGSWGTDLYVNCGLAPNDNTTGVVYRIAPDGTVSEFGRHGYSFQGAAGLAFSTGGAFGNFLYAGCGGGLPSDPIVRFGPAGGAAAAIHFTGFGDGSVGALEFGPGVDGFTTDLYFHYAGPAVNDAIYRLEANGVRTSVITEADVGGSMLWSPVFARGDVFGNSIYVLDGSNTLRVNADGSYETFLPGGGAMTFDGMGSLYLVGGGNLSRVAQCPTTLIGDVNCDGVVTVGDIAGFVLALTDAAGYAQQFPDCDIATADVNEDGAVTVSDIGPFVALLTR